MISITFKANANGQLPVNTNNALLEFNQSLQDCRIHFLIPNFILSLQEKQT